MHAVGVQIKCSGVRFSDACALAGKIEDSSRVGMGLALGLQGDISTF
jgi:hypothetical protein